MKKYIPVVLAIAYLLVLVSDSQAQLFRRRPDVKVVINNNQPAQNVQKVVVQQQKFVAHDVQQIIVKDVQKIQRFVVQPVQLVQQAYAVQIQPVQAVYQVQQLQSYGYGAQALNLGSACSTSAAQIQQLQQQVQQLQQAEVQRLQAERQRLTAPMAPPK